MLVAVFIAAGFFGQVDRSTAQDTALPEIVCTPLDVVILLDQSESMALNDANNLRIDSVTNVFDILYENAALMCPGTTHRLGVVGFGTNADVLVEMTDIRVDDPNSEWERERDRLGSRVTADQLGLTSLRAPLEEANSMFQTPISDEETRGRVILILSDGAPCTLAARNLATPLPELGGAACQDPDWLVHYLTGDIPQLQDYNGDANYLEAGFDFAQGLDSYLESTQTLGGATSLNVLLFSRNATGDIPEAVNQAWRQVTGQRNGEYYSPADLQNDQTQVTVILENLISERIGNAGEDVLFQNVNGECAGEIVLEPYRSSTTIIATTRPNVEDRVRLFQPDGTEIIPQNTIIGGSEIRYNEGRTRQRFIISDPVPGVWRLIDPTGICEVQADNQTISVTPSVTAPIDVIPVIASPFYGEDGEDYLNVFLTDSFAEPFNEIDAYPLNVMATIGIEPISSLSRLPLEPLTLTFSFIGDGQWRSTTPVPAPVRGAYTVNIEASVESVVAGNPPLPIFTATGNYTTAEPTPISLRAVSPIDGAVLPLNSLTGGVQVDEPFGVEVEFVNAAGDRQPYDVLFPLSAEGVVTAELRNASNQLLRTVTLMPSTDDPYRLVGEFRKPEGANAPDAAGSYSVTFSLTAAADAQYNRENYVLQTNSPSVSFERRPLRGMRLITLDPTSDEAMMLNRIEGGIPIEIDIPVEVELVDQNGVPLAVSDVFTSDANAIVTATLTNPSGAAIQTIPLSLEGRNRFSGAFTRSQVSGSTLELEGNYTISFEFGGVNSTAVYDRSDFAYLSPSSTPVSFRRVEQHGVLPVLLTVAGNSPTPQDAALPYQLNSLDETGQPIPTAITVTAVLSDLEGTIYTPEQLAEFVDADVSEVLEATITGPEDSNISESIWLTRTDTGRYTGVLRDALSVVDTPGMYTISLAVNSSAISSLDNRYLLVSDEIQTPAYVDRYTRHGMSIEVASINGREVVDPTSPISLSLYLSPVDALTGSIKPILFTLRIFDTSAGTTLAWSEIARVPGENEESLTVSQLVRVGVQGKNSAEVVYIEDLTEERLGDNSTIIRGEIKGIENTDEYVLFFGLNSDNLNRVSVENFRDIVSNRGEVEFARAITDPLTNPLVVRIVAGIIAFVLFLLLVWILLVNVGPFAMRGEMTVSIARPGARPVIDVISLGGFTLSRTRRGKQTKATVRRGRARSAVPNRPGFGAAQAAPVKGRRTYDVTVYERPLTVPEGGEGATIGGYKAKHQYRTRNSAASAGNRPPPPAPRPNPPTPGN